MKSSISFLVLLISAMFIIDCSSNPTASGQNDKPSSFIVLNADGVERETAPSVSPQRTNSLVQGNIRFAFDLYDQLTGIPEHQNKNLLFSPYSVSVSLAMTMAGAEGETKREMHDALRFALEEPELHRAFNKLDLSMEAGADSQEKLTLSVVNSLWGEKTWHFEPDFLSVLALNYGAGMNLVDFANDPDGSRIIINSWVEEQTESKIKDLLPEGSVDPYTALVLTNAIYFLADWLVQFNPEYTEEGDFTRIDGSTVTAHLMSLSQEDSATTVLGAVTENYKAIELAYAGERFAMLAVLPNENDFKAFEKTFGQTELQQIVSQLDSIKIKVKLPRFTFGTESVSLKDPLINLGMQSAFGAADFSGIDGTDLLFIDDVYHKAFIRVNEQGTEASAATGVVMNWKCSDCNSDFIANRPFIYFIRDRQTGAVLFVGRVMDPTDEGDL